MSGGLTWGGRLSLTMAGPGPLSGFVVLTGMSLLMAVDLLVIGKISPLSLSSEYCCLGEMETQSLVKLCNTPPTTPNCQTELFCQGLSQNLGVKH